MPTMPGTCCQAQHRGVGHVSHAAAGHVVQHHGQVACGFGNGLEVLVLPFLCGLVVVGHDLQLAVGADLFGKAGQFDGFGCGVCAATGHDGCAASSLFNRYADDFAVFFYVDGRRFTRGAHDADAVGAFGNVPVDELAQGGVVHAAVFKHGGDQGDDAAGDWVHG
jgi:hypothetical protein